MISPDELRRLRAAGQTILSPCDGRILVVILRLADNRQHITLRTIAKELGVRHTHVSVRMSKLRDAGLVAFENVKGGTIRPLYRLEMFQ